MDQDQEDHQSGEIHTAQLRISTCASGHVHIDMRSICECGVHCEDLGAALDADDARKVAMELLEAANAISPVS